MAVSSVVSQSPMSPAPTMTASTAAAADGVGDGEATAADADGEALVDAEAEGTADGEGEIETWGGVAEGPLVPGVGLALTPARSMTCEIPMRSTSVATNATTTSAS